MQDLSLQEAWIIRMRSIIPENIRHITSQLAQIGGQKDAGYRKCMRENSRTSETTELIRSPKCVAKAGAIRKVAPRSDHMRITHASTSWTWTSSRMEHDSAQRVTVGQTGTSSSARAEIVQHNAKFSTPRVVSVQSVLRAACWGRAERNVGRKRSDRAKQAGYHHVRLYIALRLWRP